MEKNYYEILEIDKNASQEIIDKAYKVLVKKYHPDLQNSLEAKQKCEAKIKEINEAYEVLSNSQKRTDYDNTIKENIISEQKYNSLYNENINLKNELNNLKNKSNNINVNAQNNPTAQQSNISNNQNFYNNTQNTKQNDYNLRKHYTDAINKAYHDAYVQDLKNRGYKIKYKKTFNDYLRSLIALLITIGIIFLVLQIPFVKNYFINLYNENSVIRTIVDTIANLFK